MDKAILLAAHDGNIHAHHANCVPICGTRQSRQTRPFVPAFLSTSHDTTHYAAERERVVLRGDHLGGLPHVRRQLEGRSGMLGQRAEGGASAGRLPGRLTYSTACT